MVPCSSGAATPAMATTASSVICRLESKRLRGLTTSQAQRGKPDGVQRTALAVQQPPQQIERHHPERALHRRGKTGEERVGKRGGDGEKRGGNARQPSRLKIQKRQPATMARCRPETTSMWKEPVRSKPTRSAWVR